MMDRRDALGRLATLVDERVLAVVALGGTTNDWHAERPSDANFYNVAMGSNLPLAVGLAKALPSRTVLCLDTDGCQLMTLGALCTAASVAPPNLRVFVMDNESYAYTGAQPSATSARSDLAALARAAGWDHVESCDEATAFEAAAGRALEADQPTYVVAKVRAESPGTHRRGFDHVEAKYRFCRYLEAEEGIRILSSH